MYKCLEENERQKERESGKNALSNGACASVCERVRKEKKASLRKRESGEERKREREGQRERERERTPSLPPMQRCENFFVF